MEARIDRLTGHGPVPDLQPETVIAGLGAASTWLKTSITYWADMLDKWKARPNRFLSYRQLDDNKIDATPGGEPLIAFWALPRDQAIVIRVKPPAQCEYWAVEFGNYFWETMDYRRRLCSTNCHYAALQDDGELVVVITHDDFGHPNWLDPSGHSEGYVTLRWMMADSYPVPTVEQFPVAELARRLPPFTPVSTEQRREQVAARRRGIARRFKW